MIALPLNETRAFLADVPISTATIDGGSDGWGGLIALCFLVLAILYAMYIAARAEWRVARLSTLESARSSNDGDD